MLRQVIIQLAVLNLRHRQAATVHRAIHAVRLMRVIIQPVAQRLQLVTAQLRRVIIQRVVVHLRHRQAATVHRAIHAVRLMRVIIHRAVPRFLIHWSVPTVQPLIVVGLMRVIIQPAVVHLRYRPLRVLAV